MDSEAVERVAVIVRDAVCGDISSTEAAKRILSLAAPIRTGRLPTSADVGVAKTVGGWRKLPDSLAPHAMTVLAARFDPSFGEWIYGVVASPPTTPFTHWRPLPEPPAMKEDDRGEGMVDE